MTGEAVKEAGLQLVSEDFVSRRVGATYVALARGVLLDYYRWAAAEKIGDIRKATPADLLRYRDFLASRASRRTGLPLRHSTVNQRFGILRLLYACLYRAGITDGDPAQQLTDPLPPESSGRRAMTEEEMRRFLDALDTTTAQGLRDRALFELIYAAGLRVSEAAAVKIGDIDFKRRIMKVRGKGDKDRLVPFSEVARDVLLVYLEERTDDAGAWLFPGKGGHLKSISVSDRFRKLLRRFGMDTPEISTHSVRHATATHLLDHGVSVRQVQELLGHAAVETTARYTHVVTDNLKRIFRRYHPREQALYAEVDEEYRERIKRIAGTSDSG